MDKFKRWNIAIISVVICVVLFITGMNYFVDPFGYFHFKGGDYSNVDFQMNTEQYLRFFKAEHIKNFSDEYDAYIIGGSKTGSYRPEKLSEMDGYRYYNVWTSGGSVQNYYYYAKYILENTNAKKILVNLSGGEVRAFDRQNTDVTILPAQVTGESVFLENLEFLFKDVSVSIDMLKEKREGKSSVFYGNPVTGERNLEKYYNARSKDHEKFTNKYVLKKFSSHMKRLFTGTIQNDAYEENLEALREIKRMCDEKGVEFQLMLAPAFIGEMSEHDCEEYWNYMQELVLITDYWDFSGYNDINLNPYNYYNEGHFFYEVSDLVVDTVSGKNSYEGFGVYVTKENIYEHIQERKNDYQRLREEYLETGTILLNGYEDESNIVSNTLYKG
ncbi:MAG: hypothetical protein ACI4CZ_04775 [Hominisplanchenecus sp.]